MSVTATEERRKFVSSSSKTVQKDLYTTSKSGSEQELVSILIGILYHIHTLERNCFNLTLEDKIEQI
jgi:hypothetical protein